MSLVLRERGTPKAADLLGDLIRWLNSRFARDATPITADTRLFADGRIDSIGILHLIAWVERATGRKIPDRLVRIDYFETPTLIAERFLVSAEDALR